MQSKEKQPPIFTRRGVRNVDSDAIEHFRIEGIVLMENAARGSVDVIKDLCSKDELQHVIVLCGAGNNGGDGYAIARHLHNRGCRVTITPIAPPKTPEAITNANIAEKMGIPFILFKEDVFEEATLIIDAIFGTGISEEIRGPALRIISFLHRCNVKIISIDIPSGLDCDSGHPLGIAVKADLTITFVGLKRGFMQDSASKFLGSIAVVDIGCPQELIKKYALPNT